MDRREIGVHALKTLHAQVLVDASGPFQGMHHGLVEAAMDAGIHYVDIADDRRFVASIHELDDDARHRGVAVISGASSVPSLSSAVALELSRGLDRVDRVDISITASSQASFGTSVLESMLSGAGRTIEHRGAPPGTGMMEYRRVIFRSGGHELHRHVLSCDVPDHDEMPLLLPGEPDVRFRAGSELAMHNWTMWGLAFLVSRGFLVDARRAMPLARLARRLSRRSGDGRSAMKVEVRGGQDGRPVFREWTLVATGGHGPKIPCLVVPEIVSMLQEGTLTPGARSAAGIADVGNMLSRMPDGSIETAVTEHEPSPLYRRIMGDRFARLRPAVSAMHDDPWVVRARGRATVTASSNLVARILCRIVGFPPASRDLPVTVTFERIGDEEKWTRQFGRHVFCSRLSEEAGELIERFGPLRFRFSLEEKDGGIAMTHRGWSAFGLKMPIWLGPSGTARESGEGGLFTFDVPVAVPLLGEIVRYRGWLQPETRRE